MTMKALIKLFMIYESVFYDFPIIILTISIPGFFFVSRYSHKGLSFESKNHSYDGINATKDCINAITNFVT